MSIRRKFHTRWMVVVSIIVLIALQARIVFSDQPAALAAPTDVLDQYQEGSGYGFWFDDETLRWQEFIPSYRFLSAVDVYISKIGNPGDVIVEIRTVGGVLLAQQTLAESAVPTCGWASVELDGVVVLTPGTKYRIYVHSDTDSLSPDNRYTWRGNTASTYCPTCDTDASGGWPDYDYAFRTYAVILDEVIYLPLVMRDY